MVAGVGFEPTAATLWGSCSTGLSYPASCMGGSPLGVFSDASDRSNGSVRAISLRATV